MSNEQDPLIALATPPAVSDRFEIQGLSLSNALAHPVLGPGVSAGVAIAGSCLMAVDIAVHSSHLAQTD
jgi:hypothetical protein